MSKLNLPHFPSLSQISTKYQDWITPAWENKVCGDGSIRVVACEKDVRIMAKTPTYEYQLIKLNPKDKKIKIRATYVRTKTKVVLPKITMKNIKKWLTAACNAKIMGCSYEDVLIGQRKKKCPKK